ncbi:MAG TPA: purine-nucleoside phosphorylase [Aeromicrobium sp.]|nr:purine-nucleoside phosphorylase [Aeromicrobium sp.]HKY59160.1 purine-nucleoside phosphorylase [Aeromicrobium sp.]
MSNAARLAADAIRDHSGGVSHDVAIVLGSGWSGAVDELGQTLFEMPVTDLPGFAAPTVAGHGGTMRSVRCGDRQLLVFLGRTHLYEGFGVEAVAHPVRTAAAVGVRTIVLTNSAGGINAAYPPGTPVLISDHINLTGTSPLVGANFVDLTDLYSARIRALARQIDPTLAEGVFVQVTGPHYETPAEIRYLRSIGGDLVAMSTAVEAIAAREAGLEVLGISLVTNAAAGVTAAPLDHTEVLAAGESAAGRIGQLLARVVRHL